MWWTMNVCCSIACLLLFKPLYISISVSLFVCTLSFRELLIKSKSIYHMSWYCFLVVFDRSRFYAIGNANCGKRATIVLFNYKHGYLLLFCHVFIDWFVVSIKFIFITFFLSIFCHPIELNLSIVINYILMGNVYAVLLAFFHIFLKTKYSLASNFSIKIAITSCPQLTHTIAVSSLLTTLSWYIFFPILFIFLSAYTFCLREPNISAYRFYTYWTKKKHKPNRM